MNIWSTLIYLTKEFSNLGNGEFWKHWIDFCLNDQANSCLIHFYKRCVSLTALSAFYSGLMRVCSCDSLRSVPILYPENLSVPGWVKDRQFVSPGLSCNLIWYNRNCHTSRKHKGEIFRLVGKWADPGGTAMPGQLVTEPEQAPELYPLTKISLISKRTHGPRIRY